MIPWHRVSVLDTQSGIGKLLTSFSWNLLIAKILYSLSKCKSCRLSINNCGHLSMLVAEIKWKQMNFTCQNKLVFVIGIDHDMVCAGVVCGRAGRPTSAVPGVAAQTTPAQTVWVVNFYSTTKTKQNTTINPATIMTISAMPTTPLWWWKRP